MKRIALLLLAVVLSSPIGAQSGVVIERQVTSTSYPPARRVWVYTPPGYRATAPKPYDLLVAFDGEDYQRDFHIARIIDSLTAHGTQPFVALLIDDGSGAHRTAELGNAAKFAKLVAGELIPWVRANYRVTNDPRRTIVAGSSAGGLAAAFVAFERPDVFGRVISQSGAFWRGAEGNNGAPYEWLTAQYRNSAKRDVTFILEAGDQETQGAMGGSAPSILAANQHLYDALQAKGYSATFSIVPNGHHAADDWRTRLPAAIAATARSMGTR